MLLCVDVGNTNITFGLMNGYDSVLSFRITTYQEITVDEMGLKILGILNAKGFDKSFVDKAIISSVVPKVMKCLVDSIVYYLEVAPIVLKNDMPLGIEIKTDNPNEVGMDRIVDLVGAKSFYKLPIVVIDFGTATTYDLLDENGAFIAGVTAPGIRTSLAALVSKAALLSDIDIVEVPSIMAKNTVDSINAGLIFGQIGQAEYIIRAFQKEVGQELNVVVTGGLGSILSPHINGGIAYDKELTIKGLVSISEMLENR